MATSGTTGQTVIEVATLIEHIARRCGVQPNQLTPESIEIVKNVMFMFLSALSNRGINLWRVQRGLFGIDEGQATYVMPSGTVDVLEANYRIPQALAGTVTSSAGGTVANLTDSDPETVFTQSAGGGDVQWDFGSAQMVNLVGLLGAADGTLDITLEVSSDGATWAAARTPGEVEFTDGKWKWFNIEPASSKRYFRIRERASGVLAFRDVVIAKDWSETPMYRMNRDDYSSLPNKRSPGHPRQFWFDRAAPEPKMICWPTPDASMIYNLVSVYLHMQVQDVGQISNTLDLPQRWYEAAVSNIAFMAILDLPGADLGRYEQLRVQADRTMLFAEAEERDATPTRFEPNISPYTA